MLSKLELKNFKCFNNVVLSLRGLTIFSGANGSGKSSAIQALLLLHQAYRENGLNAGSAFPLNGDVISLGSLREVVNATTGGREFEIYVSEDGGAAFRWTFRGGEDREQLTASIFSVSDTSALPRVFEDGEIGEESAFRPILEILHSVCFVPADRVGPQEAYPLADPLGFRSLGKHAELATGYLFWCKDELIYEPLRHPDPTIPPTIQRQVEAYLADLFPGVVLELQRIAGTNLVRVGIRTSSGTDSHRPSNVGFGILYALPILIALLTTKSNSLVIIENPEAHLHPRAQVRIANICTKVAQGGAQILIETHSDHFLNAVRVELRESRIPRTNVQIYYFERGELESVAHQLEVGDGGRITNRPNGFFDEFENQLSKLV